MVFLVFLHVRFDRRDARACSRDSEIPNLHHAVLPPRYQNVPAAHHRLVPDAARPRQGGDVPLARLTLAHGVFFPRDGRVPEKHSAVAIARREAAVGRPRQLQHRRPVTFQRRRLAPRPRGPAPNSLVVSRADANGSVVRDFDFGDGSRVALSQLHASRADLAPQAQFAVHPARHEPAVGEVFDAGHPLPVTVRVAVKGSCFFSGCELHLVEGVIGGPHDEVRAPRVHGPDAYGLVGERDAHAGGVDGAVVPPAGYRRVHEFARGVGRAVSQECAQVGSLRFWRVRR